ncbi:MAG TPA: RidA family protein [Actinomycetota bacterium]|nr:RidA family protein [Actinomycetota bacterium]
MEIRPVNPQDWAIAAGGYAQGLQIADSRRLLFVSGQVPEDKDGRSPDSFDAQCRLVWRNVLAVLDEAGMGINDLVKVTTFLGDRAYREANSAIRREVLGEHTPALTVMITDIYDPRWLLEIEAIAAQ